MLGDLNLPKIDRPNLAAQNDGIQKLLLEKFVSNVFTQLVTDPTCADNILHIIVTNEPTNKSVFVSPSAIAIIVKCSAVLMLLANILQPITVNLLKCISYGMRLIMTV